MKKILLAAVFFVSSLFAETPIVGALGILFGKPIPDSAYSSDSKIFQTLPWISNSMVDSVPQEAYDRLSVNWVSLKKELVPDYLKENNALVELVAQVDTATSPWLVLRIVIISNQRDDRLARQKTWELGKFLQKKYQCKECPQDSILSSAFAFSGGDGVLDLTTSFQSVYLDYHGAQYHKWFRSEKNRLAKEDEKKRDLVKNQF